MMKALIKQAVISAGLEFSAIARRCALWPQALGRGVIFTLHHVRPWHNKDFAPNRYLEITPEFLDAVLDRLHAEGFQFTSLQDLPARLQADDKRPMAAFTLDDGYKNNLVHALPVFEKHQAPFTIFVAQGLSERSKTMWWETLPPLLAKLPYLDFDFGHGEERLRLTSTVDKFKAFQRFTNYTQTEDEAQAIASIDRLARFHGIEPTAIVDELVMPAHDLRQLAQHPLASLGAHTISHRALARLSVEDATSEIDGSADFIQHLTGRRPLAFAFPYGSAMAAGPREADLASSLGFRLAVTTQPGVLKSGQNMTYLPRMSINGLYQRTRYVSALASGIPLKLMGR